MPRMLVKEFLALPVHRRVRLVAEALGWTFEERNYSRGSKEVIASAPPGFPAKYAKQNGSVADVTDFATDLPALLAIIPGHWSLTREVVLNDVTAHSMPSGDEQDCHTFDGNDPAMTLTVAFLKAKKVLA